MPDRRLPVELQFSLTVELNTDKILEGGLDVNRGRDTTTNIVFFSAFPKSFFAKHVYVSESSLWTWEICSALLLYLTLPWGNWVDNFLHVTTGVGYLVTWQIGRVKVFPSIAWRGPGLREMRGWTETKKKRNSSFFSAPAITMSFNKFVTEIKKKQVVWACNGSCELHFVSCAPQKNIPRNLKTR